MPEQLAAEAKAKHEDMRQRLNNRTILGGAAPAGGGRGAGAVRQQYTLHLYGGSFHVLPEDWRFPSCGTLTMWQHWLVGDREGQRSVPPLKSLSSNDVAHLDNLPHQPGEHSPRPARKSLSDLKFLMNYIKQKVILEDAWVEPQDHTLETVTAMYRTVVAQYLVVRDDNPRHQRRDPHMKWQTMVQLIRKRMRAEQLLVFAAGGGGRGGLGRGAGRGGLGRGSGRGRGVEV